jgi:hypothetical protein
MTALPRRVSGEILLILETLRLTALNSSPLSVGNGITGLGMGHQML